MRALRYESLERRELLASDLQLVKDINTTPLTSNLEDFEIVGVDTYFVAFIAGQKELWKFSPTLANPSFVCDLPNTQTTDNQLTNVNGKLYFVSGGAEGVELWSTDGTAIGTVLVRDIEPAGDSFPTQLTNVGGTLYFTAFRSTIGRELWKSNGDAASTVLVRDLLAGPQSSFPGNLTAVGDTLYFTATLPTTGTEIFRSLGTSSSTILLRDIQPGAASSYPHLLVNGAGSLYFAANSSTGSDIWTSAGTAASTRVVQHFDFGMGRPEVLTEMNGQLYFVVEDSTSSNLWKSGGTSATTVRVKSVASNTNGAPIEMINGGGILYFTWESAGTGLELWRSNGTTPGTVQLKDINPGPLGSNASRLLAVGKSVYFVANDGTHGLELWKTNGSAVGTTMVKDIALGTQSGFTSDRTGTFTNQILGRFGNQVFFSARSTSVQNTLWRSGGNDANTSPIGAFSARNMGAINNSIAPITSNDSIYFMASATDPGLFPQFQLWKSDGSSLNTNQISPTLSFNNLVGMNGLAFFTYRTSFIPSTTELWRTDGTSAGTIRLANFDRGDFPNATPKVMGNYLYFAGNNTDILNSTGSELWRTDGSVAGTRRVKDIVPGSASSFPRGFSAVNDQLYFSVDAGDGVQLWKSDGTDAGTMPVKTFPAFTIPGPMTAVGADLFFEAYDAEHGNELWKTQGTEATTILVRDIWPGPNSSYVRSMQALGGKLVFSADDGVHGRELWISDGTTAGTTLWYDIIPGAAGSQPRELTVVDSRIIFSAQFPGRGRELGDASLTALPRLFSDISAGAASSDPGQLTRLGSAVYFSATSPLLGRELWKYENGLASVVSDINVGAGSANPILIASASRLYVIAYTPTIGRELYVLM